MMGENSLTKLLAAYFYQNRHLSFPGLGKFLLKEEVTLSNYQEGQSLPEGSVQFIYNLKEEADLELVRFITDRTRKMKSLALADLFTFSDQAKEMLNIGQPVSFEGIGTLKPTLQGEFNFSLGVYEANLITGVGLDESGEIHVYPGDQLQERIHGARWGTRSLGGTVIIVVCLAIVALLVYFMLMHDNRSMVTFSNNERAETSEIPVAASQPVVAEDPGIVRNGMLHYEVVFDVNDSAGALMRYNQLTGWGHHVILRSKDSTTYTVSTPFNTPAGDTTHMKDSLRVLYGHAVYILYENELTKRVK